MRKKIFLIIACLGFVTLFSVDRWQNDHWKVEQSAQINATLKMGKIQLENSFSNRFNALESIASLFVLHPDTNAEEFSRFASALLKSHAPIRAIQYADQSARITYIYPPKGNETAIKEPILLINDPKRAHFTKKAIQNKTAVLQGPFELRQGGVGIDLKFPIFKNDKFQGLAIGVYDLQVLINEALQGLDLDHFNINLKTSDGTAIWNSGNVPDNSQKLSVSIADVSWVMSANRIKKSTFPFFQRILIWLFGSGFFLVFIYLIRFLEKQERNLENIVKKRTIELSDSNDALRESEQKFKKMFEQAPLSYQSLDEKGNFIEVNQTWLQIMGYSSDEVLGKNFSKFLIPEWKNHFEEHFPRFKAVGEVLGVEFEMVKKDGSTILVSFHGKIEKDQQGNFEHSHCVFNDISMQKAAEDTLKKDLILHKAIAQISHELLSERYDIKKVSDAALEVAKETTQSEHGFVSSIDKRTLGNVGHTLHTLTKMFGEACKMKEKSIVFPIGEEGTYGGLWGHALNTKKAFFTNCPDGHPSSTGIPPGHIPLKNYMAVPVLSGDKLLGLIALSNSKRDYSKEDLNSVKLIAELFALAILRQDYETERIKMEKDLRQLQKMEAIGALAGGIAHDFNNILFPIIGFAEMMEEDLPKDSIMRENTEMIMTGAKRAKDLVKQILTFSRQVEQEIKPLKPHLIINEVAKLIRSTIPTYIDIDKNIDQATKKILADPTQLHQVAMNLITNASHAMDKSGGVLTIRLQNIEHKDICEDNLKLSDGPYVLFSIKDTGIGMDKRTLEKIFDPYFTTKQKGKGTGLGLSVVHGIIKNYGGDISVKSIPMQGTTFNVYIPALQKETQLKRHHNSEEIIGGNEHILLVDDEEPILRTGQAVLKRLGYKVELKESSIDALTAIKANPDSYDLVISDMNMPNMTGDQLAWEIMDIKPSLPIIICTGFSEKISLEKIKTMGVKALLMKPIVISKIATTVRQVLDDAKGKRQAQMEGRRK